MTNMSFSVTTILLDDRNLQEGYHTLKYRADACREALRSDLACGKPVSATDEIWLDTEANLIDEEIVQRL